MLLKSNLLRLFVTLTVVLGLSLVVFADTIRLKDGSIVKGKVIGYKDGQFVVIIGEGSRQRQMTLFSDEIETIEFDLNSAATGNSRVIGGPSSSNSNPTSATPKSTPVPTPTPASNTTKPSTSNQNVRVIGNPTNQTSNVPDNTTTPVSNNSPSTNSTPNSSSTIKLSAKVLADNTANGWTNTGWVVKKGQKIKISSTGRISLGNGRYSTPSGVASLPDNDKLIKDKPTGGLLAVIGDDNNDFVFLGGSGEFIAKRDGALFLGINEGYLDDNSGAFDTVIEIEPMPGSGN